MEAVNIIQLVHQLGLSVTDMMHDNDVLGTKVARLYTNVMELQCLLDKGLLARSERIDALLSAIQETLESIEQFQHKSAFKRLFKCGKLLRRVKRCEARVIHILDMHRLSQQQVMDNHGRRMEETMNQLARTTEAMQRRNRQVAQR